MTTSTSSTPNKDLDGQWIPRRVGPAPRTRAGLPHQQLNQIAPPAMQESLWSQMIALPGVRATGSPMSLPDSRALQLDRALAHGPQDAFAPDGGTEFVHLHGVGDGSLHMNLPIVSVEAAIAQGWAEWHPYVLKGWAQRNYVMIFGPRNAAEVDIVFCFVQLSRDFAAGLA